MLSPALKVTLSLSDLVLLVLGPEPVDISCAEQTLPLLDEVGVNSDVVGLVVVKHAQSSDSLSLTDIEHTLKKRSLGVIPPAAEELTFSYRQGVPLVLSGSESMAAIALQELAERVHARIAGRTIAPR